MQLHFWPEVLSRSRAFQTAREAIRENHGARQFHAGTPHRRFHCRLPAVLQRRQCFLSKRHQTGPVSDGDRLRASQSEGTRC